MKDLVKRPAWTAMKVTVVIILTISAIVAATIIAGLPYIICKFFNL